MKKIDYSKIRTYFYLNKKSFILATITGIIYNVLMVLVPLLTGKLIDLFKAQEDTIKIVTYALLFLIFVIFIQVNRFFKRYYVRDFANKIVLQMRQVSFENMMSSSIEEINSTSKGDIMNKTLSDIKDSAEGIRKTLTEVYDSIILMLGYFISLMIMDWETTLIVSIFLILSMIIANVMKKIIYKTTSSYKKATSNNKDFTLNYIKNEVYYRGFGAENSYYKEYKNKQDDLEKKSIKSMIFKNSLEPTYQAISYLGLFFIIYFCGQKVINDVWLIGTFSAYLSTFLLMATKTSKVGKVFNAYATMKVSWKRCSSYLVQHEKNINYEKGNDNLSLEVNNLSFGFNDEFVLKNISFSINNHQLIGICGTVHSGKSTLLAPLSGIYNYQGSIKLLGIELKDIKDLKYNNFISYAPNQVEIFNDTVKYNISFEDKDVSKEMQMTYLDREINEDDILSHSNSNLSGGQQKRLMVARCLYSNAKLMLLDDPFNAIDIDMGIKIIDNIKNNYQNSIVIIVNNQNEILKKMDKIIFLNEKGYLFDTYDNLLNNEEFKKTIGA